MLKRGIMANINQVLDPELAQDLAQQYVLLVYWFGWGLTCVFLTR